MSRDEIDQARISKMQELLYRVQELEGAIKKHMQAGVSENWVKESHDAELWRKVS